MNIKMELAVLPFPVEQYVYVQKPAEDSLLSLLTDKIHLSRISPEDLSQMCHTWRREIFNVAGKPDPDLD